MSIDRLDLNAIKTRQQAMWASGDFAVIGTTLQIVGETLCEAADVQAGERVLDVACGNGNALLAAARRGCRATGLDYVPELLARAQERAAADRLTVQLELGDAEQLPFGTGTFDAVLSTYGVMFAPDHARAASELLRVCKPGGRIGLANWTPEGFLGELLRTVAKHVPPPAGVASPLGWGSENNLRELFPGRELRIARKHFVFRYRSVEEFTDTMRRFYGPTFKAFEALQPEGQDALRHDMLALMSRHNRSATACAVPGEYVEVIVQN
ncbi:MAG TPA: class I SAM-dependent methyltransferase [Polyangiales bacterium]|nr:class I SAM-dependent methyltransferase [Polyangiales bacterium]